MPQITKPTVHDKEQQVEHVGSSISKEAEQASVDEFMHAPTPRGKFREGHCGDIACMHRDLSCCPLCAGTYEEIVDVYGQHFWIDDKEDRDSLRSQLEERLV